MNKENKQKMRRKIDKMARDNFLKVWKCIKVLFRCVVSNAHLLETCIILDA